MANIVYICARDPGRSILEDNDLKILSRRLTPDHITERVRTVSDTNGITIAIIGRDDALMVKGSSIALGIIEDCARTWWEPRSSTPEGTFALFRGDGEMIELLSDIMASYTIWYVHTAKLFVASTSQRAIICCLRSFEKNPKVYPWVLSSGCLGPDLSWDRRIQKIRGDSRVGLDRRSWRLTRHTNRVHFDVADASEEEHEKRLEDAIRASFAGLNLDWDRWVLALSGGYDSRCSLVMLEEKGISHLKCITWGERESLSIPGSDAAVARQLALARGHEHEYFSLDTSNEPVDRLLDRRLRANEGSIDHLSAAMDGYARYKQLMESGIIGLIRSDEGFSIYPANFKANVRHCRGLGLLEDYSNLSLLNLHDLERQELPDYLQQRTGESLATWRDRLNHEFTIPCVLSALAKPRLHYIEQANPLLSRRIIQVVRSLPDHLRNDKKLLKRIVNRLIPDVPIAKTYSIASDADLLSSSEMSEEFRDVLESQQAKALIPPALLNYVMHYLDRSNRTRTSSTARRSMIARSLPRLIKRVIPSRLSGLRKPNLNPAILTYRCFTICRMHQILREDAQAFH